MNNIFYNYNKIAGPIFPKSRFSGPVLIQLGELSELTQSGSDHEPFQDSF